MLVVIGCIRSKPITNKYKMSEEIEKDVLDAFFGSRMS